MRVPTTGCGFARGVTTLVTGETRHTRAVTRPPRYGWLDGSVELTRLALLQLAPVRSALPAATSLAPVTGAGWPGPGKQRGQTPVRRRPRPHRRSRHGSLLAPRAGRKPGRYETDGRCERVQALASSTVTSRSPRMG